MKKLTLMLLTIASTFVFGQGNTLYQSVFIKPKIGQATAFENAWKAHVAKYHQGDDKRVVYEILNGDYAGYYQLVDGPSSFADMDKESKIKTAHDIDYDNNVASKIAIESGSFIYSFVDTLSYNSNVQADKFLYTVYNVKNGKLPDFIAERKRALRTLSSINSPTSSSAFVKLMAGSEPQLVVVSQLKDGFKQLETNYFTGMADKFKENYIKTNSQAAWDKRTALLQEIMNSYQSYTVKRRDDLSSK